MNRHTIRYNNLLKLIDEFGSQSSVARMIDRDSSQISQLVNKTKSTTGKVRNIGDKLARELEAACGKKRYWMDTDHINKRKINKVAEEKTRYTAEEKTLAALINQMTPKQRRVIIEQAQTFALLNKLNKK